MANIYCVDIKDIVDKVLSNNDIVLRGQTSAKFLNMCSMWGIPVRYYTNTNIIRSNYIYGDRLPSNFTFNTIEHRGIKCLDEIDTICDMLLNIDECDDQYIFESISYYYETHNHDITDLLARIKYFNILSTFNKYYQDAIEYYND